MPSEGRQVTAHRKRPTKHFLISDAMRADSSLTELPLVLGKELLARSSGLAIPMVLRDKPSWRVLKALPAITLGAIDRQSPLAAAPCIRQFRSRLGQTKKAPGGLQPMQCAWAENVCNQADEEAP